MGQRWIHGATVEIAPTKKTKNKKLDEQRDKKREKMKMKIEIGKDNIGLLQLFTRLHGFLEVQRNFLKIFKIFMVH